MGKPVVTLRRPPESQEPSPDAKSAFVSGNDPVKSRTLRRLDVQTSKGIVRRVDGRELRRMTVYIPAELAVKLRVHCAEADLDVSAFIAEVVAERLDV